MAKQSNQQQQKKPRYGLIVWPAVIIAAFAALYFGGKKLIESRRNNSANSEPEFSSALLQTQAETTAVTTTTTAKYPTAPELSTETVTVDDPAKVLARNFLLVECDGNGSRVLLEHGSDQEIYPASMTKMMTLITLRELLTDEALDGTIIMDAGVIAEQEAKMAYVAGFKAGEVCTVKDLVYAMMLPSGADAAVMLAKYAAGSEAEFVECMNQLAAEMGLEHSVFRNVTGLHDDGHVSSVTDMARILQYAISDPFCREAMSTLEYTTSVTEEHPEGIHLVSTTLSRMVGDELETIPNPLHVRGGKTGFTNPAGQCLATWAEDASGKTYICVVAGSTTFEPLDAVGDTLTLYKMTCLPPESVQRVTLDAADLPLYEHIT